MQDDLKKINERIERLERRDFGALLAILEALRANARDRADGTNNPYACEYEIGAAYGIGLAIDAIKEHRGE